MQALFSEEIEDVESPEDSNAPSLYKYTMFSESEGTTHKHIIRHDKDNVMDSMDSDFTFYDVDLGWHSKSSTDALAKLAPGKKTPLNRLESNGSQASGNQASASQSNGTLCQQAREQLAIDSAEEKDKLLSKAEQAMIPMLALSAMPIRQSRHCNPLFWQICTANTWRNQMLQWRRTLPNWRASPSMAQFHMTPSLRPWQILKDLLTDNWACAKDLSESCIMAQSLMPKKAQDIEIA